MWLVVKGGRGCSAHNKLPSGVEETEESVASAGGAGHAGDACGEAAQRGAEGLSWRAVGVLWLTGGTGASCCR